MKKRLQQCGICCGCRCSPRLTVNFGASHLSFTRCSISCLLICLSLAPSLSLSLSLPISLLAFFLQSPTPFTRIPPLHILDHGSWRACVRVHPARARMINQSPALFTSTQIPSAAFDPSFMKLQQLRPSPLPIPRRVRSLPKLVTISMPSQYALGFFGYISSQHVNKR